MNLSNTTNSIVEIVTNTDVTHIYEGKLHQLTDRLPPQLSLEKQSVVIFDFWNVLAWDNQTPEETLERRTMLNELKKSTYIVILTYVQKLSQEYAIVLQSWGDFSNLIIVVHSKKTQPLGIVRTVPNKGDIIYMILQKLGQVPVTFIDDSLQNHRCVDIVLNGTMYTIRKVLYVEHVTHNNYETQDTYGAAVMDTWGKVCLQI